MCTSPHIIVTESKISDIKWYCLLIIYKLICYRPISPLSTNIHAPPAPRASMGLRLGLGVWDLEVDRSVTALLNSRAISRRNLQKNRTNEEMVEGPHIFQTFCLKLSHYMSLSCGHPWVVPPHSARSTSLPSAPSNLCEIFLRCRAHGPSLQLIHPHSHSSDLGLALREPAFIGNCPNGLDVLFRGVFVGGVVLAHPDENIKQISKNGASLSSKGLPKRHI